MDLKEQARRLIELDGERMLPGGNDEYRYFAILYAPAIARAYLDQCEENERLREALGDIAAGRGIGGADAEVQCAEIARKALGDTDV